MLTELGQIKNKISLEHLFVPENMEVLSERLGDVKRTQKPTHRSSHWQYWDNIGSK